MEAPVILVTGANGQLGKEIRDLAAANPQWRFVFLSREDLPIHHFELVRNFFQSYKPAYCINCAAYTAVDRAETEKDLAYLVNAESVGVLAAVSKEFGTRFVHISTDYVFDGNSPDPYNESHPTQPINTYGASKRDGELRCMENNPDAIIIRTAWVYSEYGNNFVKTMLRLMKERPSISVVNDQVGAPTYAGDLAAAIMDIINKGIWQSGIYHYSNMGKISWFDFASAIKEAIGSTVLVNAIPSSEFPTPAKRPSFSLLDTSKFRNTFNLTIPEWKQSLVKCLSKINVLAK